MRALLNGAMMQSHLSARSERRRGAERVVGTGGETGQSDGTAADSTPAGTHYTTQRRNNNKQQQQQKQQ